MLAGFAEVTLEGRDIAGLERFYRTAFGLEVLTREKDRVWLAVGEHARLGLWCPGEKESGDEGGRHVHYAFSAEPGTLDALWDASSAVPAPRCADRSSTRAATVRSTSRTPRATWSRCGISFGEARELVGASKRSAEEQ